MIALGAGVERGAAPADLLATVDVALAAAGWRRDDVEVVASIDTRRGAPALIALVAATGAAVVHYPAAALDAVAVPHPSATVRRLTGTGSVAEAAALLAAGSGAGVGGAGGNERGGRGAVLRCPKRRGPGVTVALAADLPGPQDDDACRGGEG